MRVFLCGFNFLRDLVWKTSPSLEIVFLSGHLISILLDNYFIVSGISQLAQCGQLGDLPELPAPDEQRLQKAASLLQQRLILRQWLSKYDLQHYYPR